MLKFTLLHSLYFLSLSLVQIHNNPIVSNDNLFIVSILACCLMKTELEIDI